MPPPAVPNGRAPYTRLAVGTQTSTSGQPGSRLRAGEGAGVNYKWLGRADSVSGDEKRQGQRRI